MINREEDMEKLIEFYGNECPHSKRMEEIVKKFEKKNKVTLKKLEVFENEENKRLMKEISESSKCRGIPLFYNSETKEAICGECSLKELEKWAFI